MAFHGLARYRPVSGGGRRLRTRKLHPQSDVDVLILGGEAALATANRNVHHRLVGHRLGHRSPVRTVAQCAENAREDVTIATNLVEARLVIGDELQFRAMREATAVERIWPSDTFFAAKWEESSASLPRHSVQQGKRQGRSGGTP